MISSVDFAKFIILRASDFQMVLGETKLHKLLYICDGYLLALENNIIAEQARAWNYGPVYPCVRKWLSENPTALQIYQQPSSSAIKIIQEINVVSLVDFVLSTYGKWTAAALSLWSHKPGSPWELALSKNGGTMNCTIEKNDMKIYFATFLKK